MYARVTTYTADPAQLDAMMAQLDALKGQIKAIPGVVDAYSAWRDSGEGITMAIYTDKAAADAAAEQVKAIWAGMAGFLTGVPNPQAYENCEHMTA